MRPHRGLALVRKTGSAAVRAIVNAAVRRVLHATTLALLAACAAASLAAPSPVGPGDPGTCDPERATCVKACPPLDAVLGRCKPGDLSPGDPGPGGPGPGGACTPAPGGDPHCGGDGPATIGGGAGGGVPIGGGNPINLITGNKYQEETDLVPLPGVLGLELKRHYNSQVPHAGLVGAHWRIGYETVLYDVGPSLQIVQADGRRLMFQRGSGAQAALCSSTHHEDGQVRIEPPSADRATPTYHWRWPDGRTLTFGGGSGGGHPLQSITAPSGHRLTLHYGPDGTLLRVRDPQGRELRLVYAGHGRHVQAIDTPLGRIRYTQDRQGRLVEATHGDVTRVYHHEPEHSGGHRNALTGITLRGPDPQGGPPAELRLATWRYNAAGQAVLGVRGRPREVRDGQTVADTGIEQIELDFAARALPVEGRADRRTGEVAPRHLGRTVITNALGQKTEVLHAVIGGHHRLVEMRGAGCADCGPPFMRYGWDMSGRLRRATRLHVDGRAFASRLVDYDAHGRVARIGRQQHGPRGEPGAVAWMTRYAYDDRRFADGSIALAAAPSRIERPSVVAGRLHEWHIGHDTRGRPSTWLERGYSPLDERGHVVPGGRALERTVTWRYADIGGVSVPMEFDGPLPNGPTNSPADSDITRLQWDAQGRHVVAVVQPLDRRVTLTHDTTTTGLPAAILGPGATGQRRHHGSDGRLVALEDTVHDHVVDGLSVRRDLLGRIVEVSRLGGRTAEPVLRRAFDVAGRLRWQADRRGVLHEVRHDPEGHLLMSRVRTATMQQEERYGLDALGRIERIEDDTGSVHRLVHDTAGRIDASVDPLGRMTRYAHDPASRLVEATLAAGTAHALSIRGMSDGAARAVWASAGQASARRLVRRWFDDFGREVMTENADGGRTLRRHDDADRVTQLQDETGTIVDIAYDVRGRVVSRTVSPHAASGGIPQRDAVPQTTRYRYEGDRLVAVLHPQQDELFEHDDAGRLVARTVRLASMGDGARIASSTAYRYDTRGRLVATSLPDGSELHYDRDGQGQVVAVRRRTLDLAPFGWGDELLVSRLQRDLIGPRHVVYGNGVVGRWQRSRSGVLARIVYTRPQAMPPPWRTALEGLARDARAAEPMGRPASTGTASDAAWGPGAFGLPAEPRALWDMRLLFDPQGNVVAQGQFAEGAAVQRHHTAYLYDAHDQLAQAVTVHAAGPAAAWRYHHDGLGHRLLMQEEQPPGSLAHTVALERGDPAPRWPGMALDVQGRVGQLSLPDGQRARYAYDHRGLRIGKRVSGAAEHTLYDTERHRIADLDARGRIVRQYVWLGDQPIAVIDLDEPRVPYAPPRTLPERVGRAIAAAWRLIGGRGERVAYVHVNHLGAPVLMTDRDARPVWSADYAPFGRRLATASRLDRVKLQLRLPGQWEDEESGLHYNDQRYYDPDRGRYLTADPLGLRGGLDAHAYAGNNPVRYSDPLGLLLFAFDGTGNDDSDPGRLSNVVRFRDLYAGRRYYITGPGTRDPRTGIDNPWYAGGEPADIVASLTGSDRIARLIDDLDSESNLIDDGVPIDIDVIGFSRGAAEARDFANRIAKASRGGYYRYATHDGAQHCQKVDLRFMGLWDTVLSTHTGTYDLGIPSDFDYVAHAVALNEYRSLFPLESIRGGPAAPVGSVRIERGFLGSHSDIGGSFADGDLATVALSWMVDQAKAAGLAFLDSADAPLAIANPVLHDKSSNLFKSEGPAPTVFSEDRIIRYLDGNAERERRATVPGMSYGDTGQFIRYDLHPQGDVAGQVDLPGYVAWLNAHGYGIDVAKPMAP
jgi:RHS repeat-associated protein